MHAAEAAQDGQWIQNDATHFVSWNYKQIRNDLNLSSAYRVTSLTFADFCDILWLPVRCGSSIESRSSKVSRLLEHTLLMASHIHWTHLTWQSSAILSSTIPHFVGSFMLLHSWWSLTLSYAWNLRCRTVAWASTATTAEIGTRSWFEAQHTSISPHPSVQWCPMVWPCLDVLARQKMVRSRLGLRLKSSGTQQPGTTVIWSKMTWLRRESEHVVTCYIYVIVVEGFWGKSAQFWKCWRSPQITKVSLLAGVGFALAMNWRQTGCSLHDFSCRAGFGPHPPVGHD